VPVPKWTVTVSPGETRAFDGIDAVPLPTRSFQPDRSIAALPLLRSVSCGSDGLARLAPAKAIGARAVVVPTAALTAPGVLAPVEPVVELLVEPVTLVVAAVPVLEPVEPLVEGVLDVEPVVPAVDVDEPVEPVPEVEPVVEVVPVVLVPLALPAVEPAGFVAAPVVPAVPVPLRPLVPAVPVLEPVVLVVEPAVLVPLVPRLEPVVLAVPVPVVLAPVVADVPVRAAPAVGAAAGAQATNAERAVAAARPSKLVFVADFTLRSSSRFESVEEGGGNKRANLPFSSPVRVTAGVGVSGE
jgi:hypothetical protein